MRNLQFQVVSPACEIVPNRGAQARRLATAAICTLVIGGFLTVAANPAAANAPQSSASQFSSACGVTGRVSKVSSSCRVLMNTKAITALAQKMYIWSLPAEFMYRFAKYNELVTAPANQLAYEAFPAAWNNQATNAGDSSVFYVNGNLDLTSQQLVLTIPATNPDYTVTQLFDNFINVFSNPGTRTTPTNSATSYLLVGPKSKYAHSKTVSLKGFSYKVIASDTNRAEMLVRILADTLAPASSPNSPANTFNTVVKNFILNKLADFQGNGNKPVPPKSYTPMVPTADQVKRAAKWDNTPTNAVAFFKQVGASLKTDELPTRKTGLSGTLIKTLPSYIAPQAHAGARYYVPSSGQQSTLALFKPLGLTQNGFTIPKGWGKAQIAALQQGFDNGRDAIQAKLSGGTTSATNFWAYINKDFGTYPNTPQGYEYRAIGVIAGGFPNIPVDGFYSPIFTNNSSGTALDGNNVYSLTFTQPTTPQTLPAVGITPPMALNSSGQPIGFWSLTLYQPDRSEAAAPYLTQASTLNTSYSTAGQSIVSINTGNTVTVPASDLQTLQISTPIMFGSNAATYGLTPNVAYYIASTPVQSGSNYTFQISTQWKQALSSTGVPIQNCPTCSNGGVPGAIVTLTPNASPSLTYGVVQPVSQLGSSQLADGTLQLNDGTHAGYPAGSYTLWLAPTKASLPSWVNSHNWLPTPGTAQLQSIYGTSTTLNTTIEPMIRMYDAQPGSMAPSILPCTQANKSACAGGTSSYIFPPLVTVP